MADAPVHPGVVSTGGRLEGRSSEQVRGAAESGAAPVGPQRRLHSPRQCREIPVVYSTVVQLEGELVQQPGPVPTSRRSRDPDLDSSLDDLDRGSPGGSRPCLLPSPVPAGGRARLGDRSATSRSDRASAPPTGRRGGPSFWAVYLGDGRVRMGPCGRRLLDLLTPLPLAGAPSSLVSGAAAGSHTTRLRTGLQKLDTTSSETLDARGVMPRDLGVASAARPWGVVSSGPLRHTGDGVSLGASKDLERQVRSPPTFTCSAQLLGPMS
jgi:hypothetical protein